MKRIFQAKAKDGKLEFKDPVAFYHHIWHFKPEDDLVVTVEKPTRQRSNPQNKWYWGVILPVIAKETGNSTEELHEVFKRMFLPKKIVGYHGKQIAMPSSTTDCSTLQFGEYLERVIAEAAGLGITIPSPDQVEF